MGLQFGVVPVTVPVWSLGFCGRRGERGSAMAELLVVHAVMKAEYVARHGVDSITKAIDRVLEAVPAPPDAFVRRAARATLKRIEWED